MQDPNDKSTVDLEQMIQARVRAPNMHLVTVDYERLKEYVIELEASRRDLWGVNEELRTKIVSLEQGQQALIDRIEYLRQEINWVVKHGAIYIEHRNRLKEALEATGDDVAAVVGFEPIHG